MIQIFSSPEAYRVHMASLPDEPLSVEATVREILERVQEEGDTALREYTERFDGVSVERCSVGPSRRSTHMRQDRTDAPPEFHWIENTFVDLGDPPRHGHQRSPVSSVVDSLSVVAFMALPLRLLHGDMDPKLFGSPVGALSTMYP